MAAMIQFDAPVVEFAQTVGIKISTAVRLIGLDLMKRIVLRTPVDTGRARSGWDLTVGAPSDHLPPATDVGGEKATPDMKFQNVFAGGAAGTFGLAGAASIDGIQAVYIVNNLPYIERLENGHSKQAPSGMVRLSMAEVEAEIELLLAKLKE